MNGAVSGVVRFDKVADGLAEISVALAEAVRGKGLGRAVINATSRSELEGNGFRIIRALVRDDNLSSRKAFLAAGYKIFGCVVLGDCRTDVLVKRGPHIESSLERCLILSGLKPQDIQSIDG